MKREEDERRGRKPENEQADDVATLYSWANLHGAKYRDFSASRQEARAQMRQRVMGERAREAREEARGEAAAGFSGQAQSWQSGPSGAPSRAGETRHAGTPEARDEEKELWETLLPGVKVTRKERAAERPAERAAEPAPYRATRVIEGTMPPLPETQEPETPVVRTLPPAREDEVSPDRSAKGVAGVRYAEADSAPMRPAWLGAADPAAAGPEAGTLPPPQERAGSRWFALRGLYERGAEEAQPRRDEGQAPVLAVFSLAGGVGKTSLVASVGRALAARGEHVLLADTCLYGVLPFYFGARDVKAGVLRTFSGSPSDTPVHLLTLDGERAAADPELLRREVAAAAQDASRVLIDVATGSAAMLRQALRLAPTVLVPVVPDMSSVVTLQSLETFFKNQEGLSGHPLRAWYVLNQFDPSMPLQLDVREVLRQQLGERLLPFAIHRSTAVSESLAEGMTVIDYAPNSPAAEDIMNLVTWIRNTSVAATSSHRGMRWSER